MSIYAMEGAHNLTMESCSRFLDKLYEKYDSTMPFVIHRNDFLGILMRMPEFDEFDVELFNALFTMFDYGGNDHAAYREVIAAAAGCLLTGTPAEKLEGALELYDYLSKTGSVSRKDMVKVRRKSAATSCARPPNHHVSPSRPPQVLTAINNTASFFGDRVHRLRDVQKIVDDLFDRYAIIKVRVCRRGTVWAGYTLTSSLCYVPPGGGTGALEERRRRGGGSSSGSSTSSSGGGRGSGSGRGDGCGVSQCPAGSIAYSAGRGRGLGPGGGQHRNQRLHRHAAGRRDGRRLHPGTCVWVYNNSSVSVLLTALCACRERARCCTQTPPASRIEGRMQAGRGPEKTCMAIGPTV